MALFGKALPFEELLLFDVNLLFVGGIFLLLWFVNFHFGLFVEGKRVDFVGVFKLKAI